MSQEEETRQYIQSHINRVRKWIVHFSNIFFERGKNHDESKLNSPEIEGWTQMDLEPRYPYGSKEYEEKKKRYEWLFNHHYENNRHHPEYFEIHKNKEFEMDILDLLEMLCDWCGYRDSITYSEASKLVDQQCQRYNFSDEIKDLLLNTLKNNFVTFGGKQIEESTVGNLYDKNGYVKKKKKETAMYVDVNV